MDPLDRLCLRLGRHRRLERSLRQVLPTWAITLLGGATAVACVRLVIADGAWLVPTLVATAILLPLIQLPAILRQRDPPWLLAALADRLVEGNGLGMALAAQPAAQRDPAWLQRLQPALAAARLPQLRLPAMLPVLGAALLLGGALLLPQFQQPPALAPILGSATRAIESKLEALRDQQLAPPEAVQAYAERLAAVREAIAGHGLDQQTWAALDALEGDVTAERARAADRLADALAKAEALGALGAEGTAERVAQAAADMAGALAELDKQAPGLAAMLPPGAEREALLRLAQEGAGAAGLTEQQRAALGRLGLGPQPAGKPGPGDAAAAQALARRLADQLAGKAGGREAGAEDGPGSGEPGPGGGHPGLNWGAGSRVAGGYRDRLAPGTPSNPEAGAAIGAQARAPRADEVPPAALGPAALTDQQAVAADRRTSLVAPRHRAARDRYFAAGAAPPAPERLP